MLIPKHYPIIVLLLILVVGWGIWHKPPKNASNELLQPYKQGFTLIQGNSLLPISPPVYPAISVLASMVIDCESGGNHEGVWGKANEFGVAQFKEETFYWMADLAGLENADWKNKEHQIYLLEWAITNNYAKQHWVCFPKSGQ